VLVAVEPDGELIGFGSLSPYKSRPGYSTTVEDSIYVRRDRHGQGVGQALLAALVDAAAASGFHAVMARIVGGHEASIGLHARLGFEIVGHERQTGRKFNQWFDVITMERLLD
jgi:phosphinothricin acetyltransferase